MSDLRLISEADAREMDRRIREYEEQFAAERKPLSPPRWRRDRYSHSQDDEPAVIEFVLKWDDRNDDREYALEAIRSDYGNSMAPIIARAKREALPDDARRIIELWEDARANGYVSLLANELFAEKYRIERRKRYKPREKTLAKVDYDYRDKYAGEGTKVDRRESSLLPDAEYKRRLYEKFLTECYRDRQNHPQRQRKLPPDPHGRADRRVRRELERAIEDLAVKCAVAKFRRIEESVEFDIKVFKTLSKQAQKMTGKKKGVGKPAYFIHEVTAARLRTYMRYSDNHDRRIAPRPNLDDLDLGLSLARAEPD